MLAISVFRLLSMLSAISVASPAHHDSCERDDVAYLEGEAPDESSLLQHSAAHREIARHKQTAFETCTVGASVPCSLDGSAPGSCAGDQCCAAAGGTVTCPSASEYHLPGCSAGKSYDCTSLFPVPPPVPPAPSPEPPHPPVPPTSTPIPPGPPHPPAPAPPTPTECDLQPNPPRSWGEGTYIFSPTDNTAEMQRKIDAAYAINGGQDPPNNGHFSDKRYAFLFQPGEYKVNVPVGFYTSVAGLGDHPDKVVFSSEKGVYCEEGARDFQWGALDTFWRSAENFKNEANYPWWGSAPLGMLWAVSQAAPLRRIHAMHDVWLAQYQPGNDAAGYASGGFMADSQVEGNVQYMSQQQFCTRNVQAMGFIGGAWNFVNIGNSGNVPQPVCPGPPAISVQPTTPRVAEKPYIVSDGAKFSLHVPAVRTNIQGPSWAAGAADDVVIDFQNVYVATDSDSAKVINAKIACDSIKALVLTAGIYMLEEAIRVSKPDFVVLGLGLATLIPTTGNAAIEVAGGIGNVRLASVLLEAGRIPSETLLDWGSSDPALREAPTSIITDLFTRNGGPNSFNTFVRTFVHIKTNNVVGDNFWLWRADHSVSGETVSSSTFPTDHGIIVDGDNCIFYGLMVEHTLKTMTIFNGDKGQTYFLQSEFPYDVTEDEFGAPGYVGYKVADTVKSHKAVGLGVYSNFYNNVKVDNAILAPVGATVESAMTVHLNNLGTIAHVVDGKGAAANAANQRSVVCNGQLSDILDQLPPPHGVENRALPGRRVS